MKFRMFTLFGGNKVAVNVDHVAWIKSICDVRVSGVKTVIHFDYMKGSPAGFSSGFLEVVEDYDTVLARLNTIAD